VASGGGAAQHLGRDGARRVLEIRGAETNRRRQKRIICAAGEQFFPAARERQGQRSCLAHRQGITRAGAPRIEGGYRASSGCAPGSEVRKANLWRGFSRCLSRWANSAAAPVDGSLRCGGGRREVMNFVSELRARGRRDRRSPETGGWRRCRMLRQRSMRKRLPE